MLGLLLLAVGATLAALAFEVAWYGLVNHVDPMRVLRADIDPDLCPRPCTRCCWPASRSSRWRRPASRRIAQTPLDEALYPRTIPTS
jgi:hypothetical protein